MDTGISTVIIAIITGVFSVIIAILQKNQEKISTAINEQNTFIEREKAVKQRLVQSEKRRDGVIQKITILSMKININVLVAVAEIDESVIHDLQSTSLELEKEYQDCSTEIDKVTQEFELLISVSKDLQNLGSGSKNK